MTTLILLPRDLLFRHFSFVVFNFHLLVTITGPNLFDPGDLILDIGSITQALQHISGCGKCEYCWLTLLTLVSGQSTILTTQNPALGHI